MAVFESGGYTMKEIGEYFKVHYSTVAELLVHDERADPKKYIVSYLLQVAPHFLRNYFKVFEYWNYSRIVISLR
jgi:hypothetical protein